MNILATLLLLGVSALPINTEFEEEVLLITSDDIEKKRSPVFFAVHRMGLSQLSIDFVLTNPASMLTGFGPYQLCVFHQPVSVAEMPGTLNRLDLIKRTETVGHERATFEVHKEEIPRGALLIYLAADAQASARKVRGYCLPLAELIKTVRLESRRPWQAAG